jgi:hypothetical protein
LLPLGLDHGGQCSPSFTIALRVVVLNGVQ